MAVPAQCIRTFNWTLSRQAFLQRHLIRLKRPRSFRIQTFTSHASFPTSQEHPSPSRLDAEAHHAERASSNTSVRAPMRSSTLSRNSANESMPPGWEDDPNYNISAFSQLPHRHFGFNQHMLINEEFKEALRQVLWQFRAPIRYAFAYGSGVFSQNSKTDSSSLTPHPNPPEAIAKWQKGGGKVIDFIFGVTYTEHWHSLNLQQHRDHYSFLGSLGSGVVSWVQDKLGAGVYFNPYVTVNGIMIKYGVVNLDTICQDLNSWNTLYLAGRLHKPVKILRDDPRVRLANQINLISALRTALLMLGPEFTEKELYTAIAGISYMGDPRMRFGENPHKVANIVTNQLPNFRLLYSPLIENLPNISFNDSRANSKSWSADPDISCRLQQDMDPVRRGNMVRRLPTKFRRRLYFHYQSKFRIPGREFKKILGASLDEDEGSFKRREGGEFERRIAGEDDIESAVADCIRKTVRWPSTVQTLKGVLTAGPVRSWRYAREKTAKARQGRGTAAPQDKEKESKGATLGGQKAENEEKDSPAKGAAREQQSEK